MEKELSLDQKLGIWATQIVNINGVYGAYAISPEEYPELAHSMISLNFDTSDYFDEGRRERVVQRIKYFVGKQGEVFHNVSPYRLAQNCGGDYVVMPIGDMELSTTQSRYIKELIRITPGLAQENLDWLMHKAYAREAELVGTGYTTVFLVVHKDEKVGVYDNCWIQDHKKDELIEQAWDRVYIWVIEEYQIINDIKYLESVYAKDTVKKYKL